MSRRTRARSTPCAADCQWSRGLTFYSKTGHKIASTLASFAEEYVRARSRAAFTAQLTKPSKVDMSGWRALQAGQTVEFTFHAQEYESFDFVADYVLPASDPTT